MIKLDEIEKHLPYTKGLIKLEIKYTVGGNVYEILAKYKNKKLNIKGSFYKYWNPKIGFLVGQRCTLCSYNGFEEVHGVYINSSKQCFSWKNKELL